MRTIEARNHPAPPVEQRTSSLRERLRRTGNAVRTGIEVFAVTTIATTVLAREAGFRQDDSTKRRFVKIDTSNPDPKAASRSAADVGNAVVDAIVQTGGNDQSPPSGGPKK